MAGPGLRQPREQEVPPFVLQPPRAREVPLVVSIPHTGTWLPESTRARLASPKMQLQPMTDWHLHRLYDFVPELGASLLHATVSRFVVDLNRPPQPRPLYPGRFETGLVPLQTFHGEPVFREPPGAEEIEALRLSWHAPYHQRLQSLLDEAREKCGRVVLVDAHSVASGPNRLHGALEQQVYLGDRDGASCGAWLRELLQEGFSAEGLAVALNAPYKGGYITDHYGRQDGVEAIQIEMTQRVYMDEDDPPGGPEHPRFDRSRQMLRRVLGRLADLMA